MSYLDQIAKDLFPFRCSDCSELFWLRPASAQKVTASGKQLRCRTCAELKGFDVAPWPYCARLTKDEEAAHEWELYCQEQNVKNLKEATDHLLSVSPPPSPQPVMARQKHVSPHEEQLRLNLKNSLLATGISAWEFGQAAGFGSNATKTIERFIEGTGKRATMISVLAKIESEMKRRGWTKDSEVRAEAVIPETSEPEPAKAAASVLTQEERFRVIHAVLSVSDPSNDGYRILGKLFPNS